MRQRSRKSSVSSHAPPRSKRRSPRPTPIVFAVWLDTTKELTATDASLLENKVVVDPSNPLGFDESGQHMRPAHSSRT
jgi:hypothetical protein